MAINIPRTELIRVIRPFPREFSLFVDIPFPGGDKSGAFITDQATISDFFIHLLTLLTGSGIFI
jgi:hypothetical protein